jgi:hypothetical protein
VVEHTDGAERPDEADGLEALQRIEQAERLAVVGDFEPAPRRRRRWPRRLAFAGVALLVIVALLPTAAGPLLRPRLAHALGGALGATVRIDRVGLSWFGSQRIDGLRILDDRLREHAALDLRLDRSLLDLARGWTSLGTLTARGTLDLEERADGSVAPLPAPSAGGGNGGPVRIPAGLSGAVRIELDRVRYTDRAGIVTEASGVVLDAALTRDGGVTVALAAGAGGGSVSARGAASGVFGADGVLDAANASGTIEATLTDLPASLAALAMGDRAALLGERISGTVSGDLSARGGALGVTLDSAGASASGRATIRRGADTATVSFAEPAVVRIAPETVAALVPDLAALAGADGPFRLDALPGATLEVRRGEAAVGGSGRRLGEASFDVSLRLDAVSGWLDGKPWSIEPLEIGAASLRLADGISIEGVTTARLDGRHAGVLVLSGSGLRVLDESGAVLTDAARYAERGRASLEMTDVKTAVVAPLLGPLLEPLGLRLDRDLGETVAFEAAFGSQPRPTLVATLEAERVSARAGLRLREGVVETDDAGIRVEMASAAPVLSGLLSSLPAGWSVRVDGGASVEAWARGVSVDLAGLGEGAVDLRAVRGEVDVRVGESAGEATIAGVPRAFVLRPVSFTADLRSIEREAAATLSTSVWLDGQPAGDLTVSLRATELVDERGALRPGVPPIEGEIAVREALLTSLDPLWPGLEVARAIGERGTVIVTGRRDANEAVRVETEVRAANLRGGGSLAIEGGVLSAVGDGVTVRVLDVAPLLGAAAPSGLTVRPGGTAALTVSSLRLGLGSGSEGSSPLEARGTLAISGVAGDTESGGALVIDRLDLAGGVGGGSGVIEVNGSGSFGGGPMLAAGRLTAADLIGADGMVRPLRSVLSGRVDLTGVPVSLVELGAPRSVSELGVELIGATLDAALTAEAGRIEFRAGDADGRLVAQAQGDVGGGGASVRGGSVRLVVDPERARQAQLRRVQDGRDPGPRLTAPAEVGLTFTGFEVASDDAVRLGGSSTVRVEASASLVGLTLGTEAGPDGSAVVRRSGELGVDGLSIESVVPVGALAGGESAELRGTVRGVLSGRGGQPMGRVEGDLSAGFAAGSLDGAVTVELRLSDVDAGALDEALLTDGLVSGAVGARGTVSGRLGGIAEGGGVRDAGLEVSLESPRLRTLEPVTLDVRADRVSLSRPAALAWTIDPVFATRHLLHQEAGAERVGLRDRAEVLVQLDALSLGRGADPFDPGVFAASGRVGAPSLAVQWRREGAEVRAWDATELGPLSGTITADNGGSVVVSLDLAPGTDHRIDADATVHPPHGAGGGPSVDVLIEAPRLPTMLVDGALDLSGGLAEVIGPTTTLRVFAQGLSRESGKLNVSANGDRAAATVIGEVRGGVFHSTEPITAEVSAIRPELGSRLSRVVPVLGEVTKQVGDGPATARIENLSVPLHGASPLSGLEADFTIDIGTARFRTSTAFGSLLRLAQQKTDGEVGRRVEPMIGTVRGGVIRYERFSVPLGEFTLRSEGSYDLGTSRVDVTTFVPVGALSDQAMGLLNTGLGSQLARVIPGLERLTMIPWRVKGLPGELSVQPDLETLRRDLTRSLNPINLINGVLGG